MPLQGHNPLVQSRLVLFGLLSFHHMITQTRRRKSAHSQRRWGWGGTGSTWSPSRSLFPWCRNLQTHAERQQTGEGKFRGPNAEGGGDKRWPTSDLSALWDWHDCVALVTTSLPSNLGLIEIIQRGHLTWRGRVEGRHLCSWNHPRKNSKAVYTNMGLNEVVPSCVYTLTETALFWKRSSGWIFFFLDRVMSHHKNPPSALQPDWLWIWRCFQNSIWNGVSWTRRAPWEGPSLTVSSKMWQRGWSRSRWMECLLIHLTGEKNLSESVSNILHSSRGKLCL